MNISKEDYIRLLAELANDQYTEKDIEDTVNDMGAAWFPADPPAKEAMLKKRQFNGMTNCLDLKREQILAAIDKNQNLQVGNFTIRIRGFYTSEKNQISYMSIDLYERKTKTPTGQDCNMDYRLDVLNDKRFANKPWLQFFTVGREGSAQNVSAEAVVNIVKWLQALKKLTVFL